MAQLISEVGIMALSCLLLVVLSAVYPVTAFQAGEQAGLDIRTEAGAVTHALPEITLNSSQMPNLRSRKVILSDRPTLGPVCTSTDISIVQNPSAPNPAGIPEFKVEILNNCASGCPPSNIHLNCGKFASAELVNPDVFKRLVVDDCLVNGGKALQYGTLIAFTYANSFKYPLSFKSATFC